MIYFSDLDRTIICSKKLIKDNDDVICIEYIGDNEISYISKDILRKVDILNSTKIFIPTTTRSIEQFNRINFKKLGINFRYAITSNGACILKDGKILESWKKHIDLLKDNATKLDVLIKNYEDKFSKEIEPYITKFRIVEDNFFYIVLNKNTTNIDFLNNFISYLEKNGWNYFKNCSKVYFLPIGMTKENAITFLMENEFKGLEFSALGDSSMDSGMLSIASRAYIPRHGDISSTFKHDNLYISKSIGIQGINEILDAVLKDLSLCVNV